MCPAKRPLALSSGETAKLGDYTLSDGSGQWLVLYFYPKDSTPGCTTEGIEFNALLPKFRKLGATVLGVSRDSIRSHQNFCVKQGFSFDLVSDADEALCRAFRSDERRVGKECVSTWKPRWWTEQ